MNDSSRRAYLRALGAAGAASVAGCSALGGDGTEQSDGNEARSGVDGGDGDWATTGRDASRASYVPDATGPAESPAVAWRTDRRHGGFRFEAPTVADDTVVAGCRDGRVYALDPDGGRRWHAELGTVPVDGPPAVADGAALVGTAEEAVVALALADGTERWRYDAGARLNDGPVVRDDLAAAVTADGTLRAFDATDGTDRWTRSIGEEAFSRPTIGSDAVYAMGDGGLHACALADGSIEWRTSVVPSSPPVLADGTVVAVVGEVDDAVAGFDRSTGEELWRTEVGGYFVEDLSAGSDRAFVSTDGEGGDPFVALDVADGSVAWAASGRIRAPVVRVRDDVVYGATTDDDLALYAFDRRSGDRLAREGLGQEVTGIAVSDGTVYAGTDEGFVRAFDVGDLSSRWRHGSNGDYRVPVAVVDGTVYAATEDDYGDYAAQIVALSAGNGEERWTVDLDTQVRGGMTVADGRLVLGRYENGLQAIELSDGPGQWRTDLPGPIAGAPAVLGDAVYVATEEAGVAAYRLEDGTREWRRDLSDDVSGPPAAVDDADGAGTVVVGGKGGLRALDAASGEDRWQVDGRFLTHPVASGDRVYATTQTAIHAVDLADGTERWRRNVADGSVRTAPAVADGRVYVGGSVEETGGGWLQAHALADGSREWRRDAAAPISTQPTVADGTVYVGDHRGRLSAFATADGERRWERDYLHSFYDPVAVAGDRLVFGGVGVRSLAAGDDGPISL